MKLEEYLDQQEQTEAENFHIDDESKANWALRKIAEYKTLQQKNDEIAEKEIYKIEDWVKSENDKAQQSIDYFQSLLGAYAMDQRENNPDFKTLKLPNGIVRFRKQQPKWNYDDEALLKYLKESDEKDLINIKESPNKSAIKKLFPVQNGRLINVGTGEVVDGVTVEEREDKIEVIIND